MKILFCVCVVLLCFGGAFAQVGDEQAVRKVVESYINKTDAGALHADAKVFSLDGGRAKLVESTFKPGKVKKGETVGASVQRIVSVDLAGNGAVAKVETQFSAEEAGPYAGRKHFQYISLLKIGGEWKIVNILMPPM